MAMDDFADSEVGIAVAATALVLSSRLRHLLHRGAVYGVAGTLVTGETLLSFGRGLARGVRTSAPRASASIGAAVHTVSGAIDAAAHTATDAMRRASGAFTHSDGASNRNEPAASTPAERGT